MSNPRKTAGIIFNPVAGRARAPEIAQRLAGLLKSLGVNCELFATARAGHAQELAATYAPEFEALAGIGGDGTINEIINGLAGTHSATPLAIVPGGTANVISRELGLPKHLKGLARLIASSPVRKIDLGEAAGRRFALCCGAGLDARIVGHISRWRGEGGIRMSDYIRPSLAEVFSPRQDSIRVTVDGRLIAEDASYAMVGNFHRYGGPFRFFRDACPDDGLLNLCIFRGRNWRAFFRLGWRAFWNTVRADEETLLLTGREIELAPGRSSGAPEQEEERGVELQIDGDMAGMLPVTVRVLPGAVRFCVPER